MTTDDLNRNIEIKSRCNNLEPVRARAIELGAVEHERTVQVDTYFAVPTGRLKLRQFETGRTQLIWYARPNQTAPRTSEFVLIEVADGKAMLLLLGAALRARGEVRKRRQVLLWKNVRIHLDEVESLGQFIELEAVVGPDCNEQISKARIEELRGEFQIRADELIAESYSDLLRL